MADSCSYSKLASDDIESVGDEQYYPVKPQEQQKSSCKKRSCKGCKGKRRVKCVLKKLLKVMILLSAVFFVVSGIAAIHTYRWVAKEVKLWTVTEPKALPVTEISKEEAQLFKDEAKMFFDMIQAGSVPHDFAASAETINGFISQSHCTAGKAFAEIQTNELKTELSIPMRKVPGGKGRYLVGTATITWDPEYNLLHAKMEDEEKLFFDLEFELFKSEESNMLNLQVLSGKFLGRDVPLDFIEENNNLLEDMYNCKCHDKKCKRIRNFIEGVAGVEVGEGEIVVHANPEGRPLHHDGRHHHHKKHHFHRALAANDEAAFVSKNKPGWKFHLARRLVGI